jgi:seryl-tRNA synthetase
VLREDPDRVRAAQAKRGLSGDVVDVALGADEERRASIADFERLRAEQKQLGKLIPQAAGEEKADLLARTKTLAADVKTAEAAQTAADDEWREAIMSIPNLANDEAPSGGEDDYVVLETVGTPRDFGADGFEPRDHIELGRILGAIDIERGAKVSGSRFYYLTGPGADLEMALTAMAMDQARDNGFTTVIPPALVKPRAMEGTGFLGQAADDVYRIEGQDMYLVGTSEVPLAAYHSDEILDAGRLPLRYAAFSPCFRKEAGSHGKDTRGIIRVHWFDKVEMFVFTTVEDSYAEHQRLLAWEKEFLDKLELAYRVIDVAAGDLGPVRGAQVRLRGVDPHPGPLPRAHLDLELHGLPGPAARHPQQAAWGTRPVATLNGTLCAMTRTIVAILETHQQEDGSVRVPEALRPYLQGRDVLKPVTGA